GDEKLIRIVIVNTEKCKPKKCRQECKKKCPVVRQGKLCIEVMPTDVMAFVSEDLCIGCGICVRQCPFGALTTINLPGSLESETTHRYGPNSFKLHRLPIPRPGEVLGLVGTNGIGKSTALKIMAGRLKLNLGNFREPPEWNEILKYFRGSELQNFFKNMIENKHKSVMKPQYVDQIPKSTRGIVGDILRRKDPSTRFDEIVDTFDLKNVINRQIDQLSGGELQRLACAVACIQDVDIYIFDEPSSYLDVKQRLKMAAAIRRCVASDKYVICVEHDLSVLDYLSDYICCFYGAPSAYGVVTTPFGVKEGINVFLDGFLPTENVRFRETALVFNLNDCNEDAIIERHGVNEYPDMTRTQGDFTLDIEPGKFNNSEIIVMLGENGTGKTTFIRMLAGILEPNNGGKIPKLNVSHKPQKISPKSQMSVKRLLILKIGDTLNHPQFNTDVIKPLGVNEIFDLEVQHLSGGELQRVALVLCLGKPADVYLIDEPSAYLDSEQRVIAAKVIRRFILHSKKTAFVVEHDFIMATYLADRVIVFEGDPSIRATARSPQPLISGMNRFLKSLNITFRRDPNNFRPRINKLGSVKDTEQKSSGKLLLF
ncbi:ATP-binding cassette sub-family E member 1-like, partial [Pempheris klunzingeri]|uniref:ATP-binding cassette sub-family E member 1-like n=1 Tax=Pempheris klunzingeri TaxID=3127111 RepID=UPI0039802D1B